ncbi:hypothetical protein ACVWZ3_000512 [Bradyrhizobium sp. i1.3.6]
MLRAESSPRNISRPICSRTRHRWPQSRRCSCRAYALVNGIQAALISEKGELNGSVVASAGRRDRQFGGDRLLRPFVCRFWCGRSEGRAGRGGDPLRRSAPLTAGGQSAWFAFLSFNKSSIVIDCTDADAIKQVTGLIENCDILIDGRDIDCADCPTVDVAAIRERCPALIYLGASWFGFDGPYSAFAATDSTIRALAGLIKLAGPVEGPPLHAPDFQTGILAGLWGFIAAASSVLARMQRGVGRSWSLNLFESMLALSEYQMSQAIERGEVRRIGTNRFWPNFPAGIYETKNGWVGITTITPAQWRVHSVTCSAYPNLLVIRRSFSVPIVCSTWTRLSGNSFRS